MAFIAEYCASAILLPFDEKNSLLHSQLSWPSLDWPGATAAMPRLRMNGRKLAVLQSSMGNMAAENGSGFTIFLLAAATFLVSVVNGEKDFPLMMPMVKPTAEESYICTPIRLSDTQTFYVNRFTPNASAHTAHHMLVSFNYFFQKKNSFLESKS